MTEINRKQEQQTLEHAQAVITNNPKHFINVSNEEINLRELLSVVWQGKWIIIVTTALFAIVAVFVSLNIPNVYKSTATLISASGEQQSGAGALAARFGGLASIAGVNFGGGGIDKTQLAIEILKSRVFLREFIAAHQLKPEIMAVKSWDAVNNKLVFNEEVYNEENHSWTWTTSSQWKQEQQPTDQEALKVLLGSVAVTQDMERGLVTISATHQSPFVAQQWVEWLIHDINQHMREQDIAEAEKSIGYLSIKLEETPLAEMQKIFYDLIEAQTKTKMLAEIRDQYVLKIIDPPTVPELKFKPKRSLMCILGAFFGGMFGVALTFLMKFFFRNDEGAENYSPSNKY